VRYSRSIRSAGLCVKASGRTVGRAAAAPARRAGTHPARLDEVTPVDRIVYTVTGLVFLLLLVAVISGMLAMVPALTELGGR
jgi:hypothetical protein